MMKQTEFKRIVSPLKYQTRCLAAFPDQQGFLVITFFLMELLLSFKRNSMMIQASPAAT